jgi:AraC-like DNA-binding protein
VPLADLIGARAADRLEDQLAGATGASARFAVVNAFLGERAREAPAPDVASAAFDRLLRSGGLLRVGDLAARLEVSTRWLEQRFEHAFGLSPKALARIVRLHAALRRRAEGLAWSAVAADAGFADQAHLTREFRALAKATPNAFYGEVARLDRHALNRATAASDFFNTFFV